MVSRWPLWDQCCLLHSWHETADEAQQALGAACALSSCERSKERARCGSSAALAPPVSWLTSLPPAGAPWRARQVGQCRCSSSLGSSRDLPAPIRRGDVDLRRGLQPAGDAALTKGAIRLRLDGDITEGRDLFRRPEPNAAGKVTGRVLERTEEAVRYCMGL